MKHLKPFNEKKSNRAENIKDCESFDEFTKAITQLKRVTKKIRSQLKAGTVSEIDDYIEKEIFGRDV